VAAGATLLAALAAALLPAACAKRATLNDALGAWQAGRHEAVVAACEDELARWEAAQPDVTAALPAALADVRALLADDPLLQTEDEAAGRAPPPVPGRAPSDPAAALRARGIELFSEESRGGDALRALADDLFSDSPLRILRATEQVTELSLRRLVPHLVANVYSPRPLTGDPGALATHEVAVRMLAVKAWQARAVRTVLLGAPAPPPAPPAPAGE
jgi:hypothetical protein